MFEKVNPSHPDKVADRIGGAILDLAYKKKKNPIVALEILIGHGRCHIINETNTPLPINEVEAIVHRITAQNKSIKVDYVEVPQDEHLAANQKGLIRCGDNGIFKGVPVTKEQRKLADISQYIYNLYPYDGKYVLDEKNGGKLIICQSNAKTSELRRLFPKAIINPLGDWTGGTSVDTGASNRKLGSDMGDSVTGGGIHSKDCSKADVSINIYAWLKAQQTGKVVELNCAIGDEFVDGLPYSEIVQIAKDYIASLGGFEKFAEWGLLR